MRNIPLTVPAAIHELYLHRYQTVTRGTDRLLLFAADQKIEHLNEDFENLSIESALPEHLFKCASNEYIGAFATHLGLIARYGGYYPKIPYVVKLNSKTHLVKRDYDDPVSLALYSVADVIQFQREAKLSVVGVGYTIYLGSVHEAAMLREAAQIILEAHEHGLLTMLWVYPRGRSVVNEDHADLIAGAAGVANALGADFVKVRFPVGGGTTQQRAQQLRQATIAAGNTKVICSGGAVRAEQELLEDVYQQIHEGGAAGAAIGRNIFTKPVGEAHKLCAALAALIYNNKDVVQAALLLNE